MTERTREWVLGRTNRPPSRLPVTPPRSVSQVQGTLPWEGERGGAKIAGSLSPGFPSPGGSYLTIVHLYTHPSS